MGLGGEVDQDTSVRLLDCGVDHAVQTGVVVDDDWRGVVGIKAQQGAMRLVGVEADEGQVVVDQILGQHARHEGLANATLFAANEMQFAHVCVSPRLKLVMDSLGLRLASKLADWPRSFKPPQGAFAAVQDAFQA